MSVSEDTLLATRTAKSVLFPAEPCFEDRLGDRLDDDEIEELAEDCKDAVEEVIYEALKEARDAPVQGRETV